MTIAISKCFIQTNYPGKSQTFTFLHIQQNWSLLKRKCLKWIKNNFFLWTQKLPYSYTKKSCRLFSFPDYLSLVNNCKTNIRRRRILIRGKKCNTLLCKVFFCKSILYIILLLKSGLPILETNALFDIIKPSKATV